MTPNRWALQAGRRFRLYALAAAMLLTSTATAQAQSRISADASIAGGSLRGGEYWNRGSDFLRLGFEYRIHRFPSGELLLGVSTLDPALNGDIPTICVISPNGGCVPPAPKIMARTAGLELRGTLASRLQIGVGAGGGIVRFAEGNAWYFAPSARASVGLRLFGPWWLTAGTEVMTWRAVGKPFWISPRYVGIRIH